MKTLVEPMRRLPAASWGLTLLLLLLLLAGLGYAHQQLQERSEAPLFRVVINGETLVLDGVARAALGQEFNVLAGRLDLHLRNEMQPWLDARLDTAFLPLETAVSDYLDWHFSLRGSYLRLAMAIGGDLDDWLEAQFLERVVERSDIAVALESLEEEFGERIVQVQQRVVEEIGSTLQASYSHRQVSQGAAETAPTLDLDLVLERTLSGGWDEARWSAAGAGGAAGMLAGRALAQRLVAGTAMRGSQALVARVAPRLGMHVARSLGTGAATTAATSPTGPAALVAGTAATAVALAGLVGTEYALLKAEESRYRDQMHAELETEIARAKAETQHAFESAAHARSQALGQSLEQAIQDAEESAQVPSQYRILGSR